MTFALRSLALVAACMATPAVALAQTAPAAADAPAVAPAPILVPAGCTASRQPSGQITIACAPTGAAAAGTAPTPPPPPAIVMMPAPTYRAPARTEHTWYGWQTLIVDAAVLVTSLALAPVGDGEASAATFLIGYPLGGPIVHWANGEVGRGFGSLGLRVGAPLVLGIAGAGLGFAVGDCGNAGCNGPIVGAATGVVAGYVAAIVIDSAVLARKTVQVDTAERRSATGTFKWSPTGGYDPKQRTLTLGLGGTF